MKDKDILNIENEYIYLLNQILIQKKEEIKRVGLTFGNIEIKRTYSDDNSYTSEVVLDFYYEDNLFDVIEFFIYHHNELKATFEEVKFWSINVIDDIINSRKLL